MPAKLAPKESLKDNKSHQKKAPLTIVSGSGRIEDISSPGRTMLVMNRGRASPPYLRRCQSLPQISVTSPATLWRTVSYHRSEQHQQQLFSIHGSRFSLLERSFDPFTGHKSHDFNGGPQSLAKLKRGVLVEDTDALVDGTKERKVGVSW